MPAPNQKKESDDVVSRYAAQLAQLDNQRRAIEEHMEREREAEAERLRVEAERREREAREEAERVQAEREEREAQVRAARIAQGQLARRERDREVAFDIPVPVGGSGRKRSVAQRQTEARDARRARKVTDEEAKVAKALAECPVSPENTRSSVFTNG
jgi:DNA repair exonuclease SbcCD ATPase subunit